MAPAQSAKPVIFWVTRPGDPGGAAVNSGLGLNTKVRRAGDQTPRITPVGRTPAYTAQTPPDSWAPKARTSAPAGRTYELSTEKDVEASSSHWILDRPATMAWVTRRE